MCAPNTTNYCPSGEVMGALFGGHTSSFDDGSVLKLQQYPEHPKLPMDPHYIGASGTTCNDSALFACVVRPVGALPLCLLVYKEILNVIYEAIQ